MDQNTKFKKKIIVCTDFNKDLKLYNLPKNLISKLNKINKIEIINFDYNNPKCKEAIVYWGNLIDDKRIQFLDKLKWIQLGCVGYDKIKNFDKLKNIKLTNSKGIMSDSVSESIFAFVFIFLRRFDRCIHLRTNRMLNRKNFDLYFDQIKNIKKCKFLIFGSGNISQTFIKKLKFFSKNINVANFPPFRSTYAKKYNLGNIKKKLDHDFVISILPEKKKYINYFNMNFFRRMKQDSFFINVGRGSVVNEKDLIKCLSSNIISGAALDVFKNEPINYKNSLFKIDNCLITPHISGLFNEYWKVQAELFLTNLNNFIFGKKLKNIISNKNQK